MSAFLLHLVAAGDTQAVRILEDRYRGLIWSLVRRFCYEPSEAEDAMQEIFIDLWRSAGRFEPAMASEATFVAMIARRRLIDRRRRAMRAMPATSMSDAMVVASPPQAVASSDEIREQVRAAKAALGTLRPAQQEVLRLSLYQGLSHERIAEATGLPLGTVKTHVRRGLMRMREILAQQAECPQTLQSIPDQPTPTERLSPDELA